MTLGKHGKLAKYPDLKLEDLWLTSSIEAMTHWLYSASFLHVKIFLKGLFPGWKDLTAHLSIVSMVKCHSLRSSSCRDQSPSNICNKWMQTCAFWRNILDYKIILVKIRTFWMLCDQTHFRTHFRSRLAHKEKGPRIRDILVLLCYANCSHWSKKATKI